MRRLTDWTVALLAALLVCIASSGELKAASSAGVSNPQPMYAPPGVGGSVRNFQTWASERAISLRDYGCVGNGVANDTACIQKAFAELFRRSGATLFVPKGVYLFTSDIAPSIATNNRYFRILGEGIEVSIFTTNNGSSLKLYSDTPPARTNAFVGVWMQGIDIRNTGSRGTSACIDIYSMQRAVITNVSATGCNYGLRVRSSWNLSITGRSQFTGNNVGIKVPKSTAGAGLNEGFNAADISGVSVSNNDKAGISIAGGNVISIRDVLAESTPVGVYVLEGVNHVNIENVYCETTGPYTRTNRAGANQAYTIYTGLDEDNTAGDTAYPVTDLTARNVMPWVGVCAMFIDNADSIAIETGQTGRNYVTFGANVRNVRMSDISGLDAESTPLVAGRGRSFARNVNRTIGNLIPNGNFAYPGLPLITTTGSVTTTRTTTTLDGQNANVLVLQCLSASTQCTWQWRAVLPDGVGYGTQSSFINGTAHARVTAGTPTSIVLNIGDQVGAITAGGVTKTTGLTSWFVASAQSTINVDRTPVTALTLTLTINKAAGAAASLVVEEVALFPGGANVRANEAMDIDVGMSGSGTASASSGAWYYTTIATGVFTDPAQYDVMVSPRYDGAQTTHVCQPEKVAATGNFNVWCSKNGAAFNYRILPKVSLAP